MWRVLVVLIALASSAVAQQGESAYEALRVVGTQLDRGYLDDIVAVAGARGNPEPAMWRISIADRNAAGGVREIDVRNGRIVAQRTPMQGVVGAPIKTSMLNLDSSGAYSVAAHTAEKSHVVFTSASYTLRANQRGIPTWIVALQDERRQTVGTIHIAANKGNVTRVEGMFRGTNSPQVAQGQQPQRGDQEPTSIDDEDIAQVDEDEEGENPIKREIKLMFRRTKRDAQRMFERVRSSFDDFVEQRVPRISRDSER
ncbi:MAG: hypothetical protein AVDCRST_MAG42-2434 [uncultured Chthoniobacterales bacterium]|uniref:Uncharacterized protein n=1 Tax=uncultured Chthoniobacterales bacterium TaxID=1836801 RepID=A0A6J4IFM1_9BACT|nr:MAG: hypothetical protein AVDCRST_MAG42-2434 [uncultured Chthoniobacterales bacterium]